MKRLRVTVDGKTYEVEVELIEDDESDGFLPITQTRPISNANSVNIVPQVKKKIVTVAGGNNVVSPMAGNITGIDVKVGDSVSSGDKVAEMEAMKMITPLKATMDGKVTEISVKVGDNVDQGATVIVIG